VLSSAKIGISSWRYYQREVATDPSEYFLARGEAPGRWWGQGLAELGLAQDGVVQEQQLEALLARGLHPVTWRRLGRAWRADGVTGFDLCFSAPKSVTGLWAIGGNTFGAEITEAHRASVRAALSFLDTHAAMSRKGIDGVEQISTAGFAAAIFDHRTSRAGDPQLHSHALVVNKLRCADGGWRTIDGHEIYHHKKAAGALYQAALRAELTQRLGVVFDPVNAHGQAEIAGFPTELTARWSKRTKQIQADADPTLERFADQLGRPLTAAERESVINTSVLKTRPTKRHEDEGVLQARWRAEAAELGWTPDRLVRNVLTTAMRARNPTTAQVLADRAAEARLPDTALAAAGTRSATFSRADVVVQVAAGLHPVAATADQVHRTVEIETQRALHTEQAVQVGQIRDGVTPRASDTRWATADLLATEGAILRAAQAGTHAGRGAVPGPLADQHAQLRGLEPEQAEAVRWLTGGGQLVSVLIAPAGAGKTTTIGAAAAAWTDAGYDVLGLAPSARAAAELSAATGTPADTVAKWRREQPRLPVLAPEQAARWQVRPRTVLLVDEAAMLATDDLAALTKAVLVARAKLVLVGDPAQIGPVERAGGLLPALAGRVGAIELTGIRRFSQPWEADTTQQLRAGNPAAWARYAAHDRIHPAPDLDQALNAVHERWQAATDAGRDALMMARARTDVDALNHRARAAALAVRDVRGPVLAHTGGRDWQAGDILRARRNDRRLQLGDGHVRNGDRFRVLGPGPDNGLIVEDLAGRGRVALPAGYLARHADYGWASTIDGAQGATADIGILLARTGLDREHLYVGMTRGRHANHVHVTSEPADDEMAHRQRGPDPAPTIDDAVRTLQTATTRIGAQQAGHTLLDQARERAQSVHLLRHTRPATRQGELERAQRLRAAPTERSRNWNPQPEIRPPSSSRSIGR
jgi:conjugative relaxase-like TrwC/TraI family protein